MGSRVTTESGLGGRSVTRCSSALELSIVPRIGYLKRASDEERNVNRDTVVGGRLAAGLVPGPGVSVALPGAGLFCLLPTRCRLSLGDRRKFRKNFVRLVGDWCLGSSVRSLESSNAFARSRGSSGTLSIFQIASTGNSRPRYKSQKRNANRYSRRRGQVHLGIVGWQYAYTEIGLDPLTRQWMRLYCAERLANDDLLQHPSNTAAGAEFDAHTFTPFSL